MATTITARELTKGHTILENGAEWGVAEAVQSWSHPEYMSVTLTDAHSTTTAYRIDAPVIIK